MIEWWKWKAPPKLSTHRIYTGKMERHWSWRGESSSENSELLRSGLSETRGKTPSPVPWRFNSFQISWDLYSLRCPEHRQNLDKLCSKKKIWINTGTRNRGSLRAGQTEWSAAMDVHVLHPSPAPRWPRFLGSSPSSRALPTWGKATQPNTLLVGEIIWRVQIEIAVLPLPASI